MHNAQANASDGVGVNGSGSVSCGPDVQLVQLTTAPLGSGGAKPAYLRQGSGPLYSETLI